MEMIKTPHRFIGFSTDTKPATAEVGSTFYEIDKRETYICFDGTQWAFLSSAENHLDIGTTIDLNQAAGDYDLFSSNTQAIIIHHFSLYIPVDISGSGTLNWLAPSMVRLPTLPQGSCFYMTPRQPWRLIKTFS